MCRLTDVGFNSCLLCSVTAYRKCPHEVAVCTNQAVHPRWKSYYYKNSGGVSTFQGCGFCRFAAKTGQRTPAIDILENPGWPGCCYPPVPKVYGWIPPEDWPVVAAYQHMEIPDQVQIAIENLNASAVRRSQNGAPNGKLSIETSATRSIQQPVPIPHAKSSAGPYQPRSYSPSAIYLPSANRSPQRSSISSGGSNSSGSPPSANGSRRRDSEFEGSEYSSNSSTSPVRSSSQDGHPMAARPSSSLQNRRGESPIERMRDKDGPAGKRRSNSDPKTQSPPSAYGYERPRDTPPGRDHRDKESTRDKERDSPTQIKFKPPSPPASVTSSSNHPYSNPYSTASSSMHKLSYSKPAPSQTFRPPAPPPRARETGGPSITSVMANMSLSQQIPGLAYNSPMGIPNINAASLAAAGARMPVEKRGVIPPHVRKAGSVSSSSSSSTNSSAREGTVISDGAFTDYLSDDSDFELQRLAEVEAEIAYQEAMVKHEEMEFKEARDSLSAHNRRPFMNVASRIRA